jgi:membrane-bound metal-dependent hydrolase YbcI (DUF457 family)
MFAISVLPDIDVVLPTILQHRGPTHSVSIILLLFLPVLAIYGKKAIPYLIALLSHPLIGDIYSNMEGTQLFWPISTNWYKIASISNKGLLSVSFELTLFIVSIAIIIYKKEFQKTFFNNTNRIYWLAPLPFVLGPLLLGQIDSAYILPFLLIFPSLFYTAIFSLSIIGIIGTKFLERKTVATINSS